MECVAHGTGDSIRAAAALLLSRLAAAAAAQKERDLKIDRMAVQVEELKTEMVLLQRHVQGMQDTFEQDDRRARHADRPDQR